MIKRFLDYFKRNFRQKNGKIRNYQSDKNTWVIYADGRPKLKLRVHVSKLSYLLSDLNNESYVNNKKKIIQEYEFNGIDGVGVLTNAEMKIYNKKLKEKK